MRMAAYILAGDPAFLSASVRAYYDVVDRIIVSYDAAHLSWMDQPIPVEDCLALLAGLDTDKKCVLTPGSYSQSGLDPMVIETRQRQDALDAASEDADWVLQFDTDEYLPNAAPFLHAIAAAERAGADAVDYPARWLYARVGGGRYLESCSRLWGPAAGYPGPLAVRAGTQLYNARQTHAPAYRVDVRPWNTDPASPRDTVIHGTVPVRHAVIHYSWIRTQQTMRRKLMWSAYVPAVKAPARYRRWDRAQRHPWPLVLSAPLRRANRFRVTSAPDLDGVY